MEKLARFAQPWRYHRSSAGNAPIIKYNNKIASDGAYSYEYETHNGIRAHQQSVGGNQVVGSNSYTSPEGIVISTSYVADESGYHPTGAHLPTPPPIPPAIRKLPFNIKN